ncbi:hypothetical protein BESB_001590 [Besnoitia besnoiti]|uniref:Transmembrane protein n=1 Tax=Besnoitia besnoiti TaxID=94643 RepID=A0A2A9MP83_BESBE|nr:hypothetical protein BESB_001590 [Besnoitia besnoiti]PFH37817.1 hypothetical protein BESB_001590 [Besnoitia besnoiti]
MLGAEVKEASSAWGRARDERVPTGTAYNDARNCAVRGPAVARYSAPHTPPSSMPRSRGVSRTSGEADDSDSRSTFGEKEAPRLPAGRASAAASHRLSFVEDRERRYSRKASSEGMQAANYSSERHADAPHITDLHPRSASHLPKRGNVGGTMETAPAFPAPGEASTAPSQGADRNGAARRLQMQRGRDPLALISGSAGGPSRAGREGVGGISGRTESLEDSEFWGVGGASLPAALQQVAGTDSPRTSSSCEASKGGLAWRASSEKAPRWAPVVGVCLFGLTCVAGATYGSLSCYLASYLRQIGLQDVGFQEILVLLSVQGALQALAAPLSLKLISFLSLPLSALLSGWLLSGSLLLSAFLLTPSTLVGHPLLFCCTYAVGGGIGAGLMHGLPLRGQLSPVLGVGGRRMGSCAAGLFFVLRCVSTAVLPLLHSIFLNPDDLSPATLSAVHPLETPAGYARPNSQSERPASQTILGERSWRLGERFYLQEEILARVPLMLMGTGLAFALLQLLTSVLMRESKHDWETSCLRGEFIGCEVVVEEQSSLVTAGAMWTFYGGTSAEAGSPRAPAGSFHKSHAQAIRQGSSVPTGNPLDAGRFLDRSSRLPGRIDQAVLKYTLIAAITALHGMASWRFVGQEDFQISDHDVSYINAGSIGLLLCFSFYLAPFFALEDACPSAPQSVHIGAGRTLAAGGGVGSLSGDGLNFWQFINGHNRFAANALFLGWLSGVRILDACTTWLLFPFAQNVLGLPPSQLLIMLCTSKAAGAGVLAWLASSSGFYAHSGIGGLCLVAGGSLVLAGLVAAALHVSHPNAPKTGRTSTP